MLWVVFSLFIIVIIIIIIVILVIIVIIIIVIITIIIINIIIIIVIIVIIIIILRRICYKFQAVVTASSTSSGAAVTGQVTRKSSRPKSCRPEPESCCPKFAVMSPEILSHVARNPKTCSPKFYLVFNLEEK